ncbi:MAG: SufD family Fe-S cluster assembly protein [Candidatus Diapherotrites archaeon]|nr:SufD family Fe-S cluster assembly protein [Candidatus Diapherotrites archaeon]
MKKYLPYGDSPTIKSYTRWERFEEALKSKGEIRVEGVEPSKFSPFEDELWWSGIHFQRARGFRATSKKISIRSKGGIAFAHVEVPLDGELFIFEDSTESPLSVSGSIKGKGIVYHVLRGRNPHFSLWKVEGDVTVHTLVETVDGFLRYRGRGNIDARGVSRGGRSDVYHVFEAERTSISNRHLLVGTDGSFLVHRPLGRVHEGGEVFLETLLHKEGGMVIGVPAVEVYTSRVKGARHAVKDLLPSEEQMFYLRSRGFSPEEARSFLLKEVTRFLLGKIHPDF